MIALPLIVGITAPTAADAASGLGTASNRSRCSTQATGNSQECASGYCVQANLGGFLANVCCTQSSSVTGTAPIYGYYIPGFTSDADECAMFVAARCCSGNGGLDAYGTCYCR